MARIIGLVLGVTLVLVLAAVLVFAVRFRSLLDPETLADRLEPRISQAVNRPVTIDGASLRLWPRPGVNVEGIRVGNRGIFSETPLATADAVVLEPRLLPLLRRQIVIDRIVVRSPRALLLVAEDGTSNFGDFVPDRSSTAGETDPTGQSGLTLDIRRVELEDGRAGYRDAMRSRSLQLEGVNLRTSLDGSGAGWIGTEGKASAEKVTVRLPEAPGGSVEAADASMEWDGRVSTDFSTFELDRGELEAGAFRARVSGRVDSLGSPVRLVDLALYADGLALADLVGETRSGVSLDGTVEVDLRLSGPAGPGQSPEVSGLATVRDGSVRSAEGELISSGLGVEAQIQKGTAAVTASGRLLDGNLAATGTVGLDSLLPYDIRLQADADLERLLVAVPAEPSPAAGSTSSLSGRVVVDARVVGQAVDSGSREVDGTATITNLEARADPLRSPIRADEVPLRLEGETVAWENVGLRIGEDPGTTSGRIDQVFSSRETQRARSIVDAGIQFARLDLDAVLPERSDDGTGWGRLLVARLGDTSIDGATPDELASSRGQRRPVELPVSGVLRLAIGTLLYGGTEYTDLDGTVRLDRQRIEVPGLQFGAYGGRGTAAASLELGSGFVEPFGLQIELQDVRAEQWLARHTPLGDAVSGTMDLEIELAGGLDTLLLPSSESLAGSGVVGVHDGAIKLNPLTRTLATALGAADPTSGALRSWISRFRIDEGAVQFSDGRFEFDRGDVDLSGSVGFNGDLDLALLLQPDPEQVQSLAAPLFADLPESTRALLAQGDKVELGLRVGGQLGRPTIRLDPSSVDRGLESAVDAGRGEIERRGLDLLRRLAGDEEDTTSVAAPDARSDSAGTSAEGGGP